MNMNPSLLLLLFLLLVPCPSTAGPLNVTIYHMNDHHSHLEAEDVLRVDASALSLSLSAADFDLESVRVKVGGFPALVTLMNDLVNGSVNPIKLHAGDAITGTSYYKLFSGRADAEMMHRLCFDAFALGNHEFDDGDEGLSTFLSYLASGGGACPGMAVLAANVIPGPASPIRGKISNYTIKTFPGGERVGIVGIDVMGKTMASSSPSHGTVLISEVAAAQENIDRLRADHGISKVILLTHVGINLDAAFAARISGADVIVGGDSHSLLGYEPDLAKGGIGKTPDGAYPIEGTGADGKRVCILQAWEYGHLLGRVEVEWDEAGDVVRCVGGPQIPFDNASMVVKSKSDGSSKVPLPAADAAAVATYLEEVGGASGGLAIGSSSSSSSSSINNLPAGTPRFLAVQGDATTEKELSSFKADVTKLKQTDIATAASDLCLDRFPGEGKGTLCGPNNTASWQHGGAACTVVAAAFLAVAKEADVAIQNGGGCRVDIAQGNYSFDDAYTLLPFSNTLEILTMDGAAVVRVLEDALAEPLDSAGSSGAYPYAAGLRFDVDASKPRGARISNVMINSAVATATNTPAMWEPLDPARQVRVVTNDYISQGKDGYAEFAKVIGANNRVNTHTEYATAWIDFITEHMSDRDLTTRLPVISHPLPHEFSTRSYVDADGCNHTTYSSPAECAEWKEKKAAQSASSSGDANSDDDKEFTPTLLPAILIGSLLGLLVGAALFRMWCRSSSCARGGQAKTPEGRPDDEEAPAAARAHPNTGDAGSTARGNKAKETTNRTGAPTESPYNFSFANGGSDLVL